MQALAAAVAAAWASGIIVVFAAGNGHWGFPGQHPDVISAGGVFIAHDGSLRASDYSSGFTRNVYPGRRVPDMSGLVGMRPGRMYIMLPVAAGCEHRHRHRRRHPPERRRDSEQRRLGGVQRHLGGGAAGRRRVRADQAGMRAPDAAQVRDILMSTARDVTTGTNHPNFGNAAVAGPDTATGNGLVDANKAVLLAKLRCISTPILPFHTPLPPIQPFQPPLQPVQPAIPFQPVQPFRPVRPLFPVRPVLPFQPFQPVQPFEPLAPIQPFAPFAPFGPGPGPGPLSSEDLAAIERMIIESDDPGLDVAAGEIVAMVVLRPASGKPITGSSAITAETLSEFAPDPGDVQEVARVLAGAGFEVGPLVGIGMSISAPRDVFERFFGVAVSDAEDGGWEAGGARELPVPPALRDRVHAITFEPPAEAVVLP